ncbi:MAG: polyprenyl synthetase family protein [Bacteroidetes bacterium]|nr:polyprenyl synthetase family protein [Bacteroidota bacterium]
MMGIEPLKALIDKHLSEIRIPDQPASLYDPITYAIAGGGKRIRPVLTLMACELFGGGAQDALNAAAGLEFFHNFTLIHDDIMDDAPLRRGRDTVYKKFGTNHAILSGDTLFILSCELIAKSPENLLPQLIPFFHLIARQVCEGQQLDMDFEKREDVSIPEYLEMIRLKTAVLLGGCLKIGSMLGHAPAEDQSWMYDFGEKLGLAFQLQDDLLDMYAENKGFGKATGGDVVANKKTFLYLKTLERADVSDRNELIDLFHSHPLNPAEKIDKVRKFYDKYDIRKITEQGILELSEQSSMFLNAVSVTEDRKKPLREIANAIMRRDH